MFCAPEDNYYSIVAGVCAASCGSGDLPRPSLYLCAVHHQRSVVVCANGNANAYGDCDGNANGNRHSYTYSHGDRDGHGDRHSYRYSDGHGDGYGHRHSDRHDSASRYESSLVSGHDATEVQQRAV